jgi:putative protease
MDLTRPEIMAPAGDPERLAAALTYGADAVYMGGPDMHLRAGAGGFSFRELARAVQQTHDAGARAYLTLNASPSQSLLPRIEEAIDCVADMAFDGIIVADPGVFRMVRRRLPKLPVHVSTQANTANAEAVRFWAEHGAARVNLARELDLRQMRAVMAAEPGVDYEVFVHGAQCLALSGRCLLSAAVNARSANLGRCSHPCRYEFRPMPSLALEEAKREGRPMLEAGCTGEYGAFFAPEDLCLVKYLPWFARLGVSALKIEGRARSRLYVAQVVDVYATALADFYAGSFRPGLYMRELALSLTRPLGTGFFLGGEKPLLFDTLGRARQVVGVVESREGEGRYRIAAKGRWEAGKPIEIMRPGLVRERLADYALEDDDGDRIGVTHPGLRPVLRCETELAEGLLIRMADHEAGGEPAQASALS